MNGAKTAGIAPIPPDGLLRVREADRPGADSRRQAAFNSVLSIGLVLVLKDEIAWVVRRTAKAQGQFVIELKVANEFERQPHLMHALFFDPIGVGNRRTNSRRPTLDADGALDRRRGDGRVQGNGFCNRRP